jgi:hypothetical protein
MPAEINQAIPTQSDTESAEDEGFEPSIGFPIHAFQACALGRYANPPEEKSAQTHKIGEDLRCDGIVLNSPRVGIQQG